MAINKRWVDGQCVYDVFVKVRDIHGKQKAKRKTGLTSLRKAKDVEFKLKEELLERKTQYTWKEWSDLCLERLRLEYKASTMANYETKLNRWINPHWADRMLNSITTADVHDLVFSVVDGVSGYTRKDVLKKIKRIFALAVEEGILDRNPSAVIRVKVVECVQGVLNASEIQTLLSEAYQVRHRFYEVWVTALLTGMRSGELYALKWTDVDFDNGFISVNKSWNSRSGIGPTKTCRNRLIPLSLELKGFLLKLRVRERDNGFVLPRLEEWTRGEQAKVLRDFCSGIGITSVKFHDLRATFITQLLKNGVSVAKVMSIVGHAELKTTQGYLRLVGSDLHGATEAMNIELPEETFAKVLPLHGRAE